MKIERLSAFAEIVGSVAIAATLVYLIVQTQQNTQALSFDVSRLQGEYDEIGAIQASILSSALFRLRENLWLQNRSGALDEELWEPYQDLLIEFLGVEIARIQWDDNQGFFAADFEEEINRLFEERQRSEMP